jgi:hypothetical protein
MGDDDGWDDEGPKAPDYISVARVIRDHIPTTNAELTLILGMPFHFHPDLHFHFPSDLISSLC